MTKKLYDEKWKHLPAGTAMTYNNQTVYLGNVDHLDEKDEEEYLSMITAHYEKMGITLEPSVAPQVLVTAAKEEHGEVHEAHSKKTTKGPTHRGLQLHLQLPTAQILSRKCTQKEMRRQSSF